jgi:REP element-mobilizing transposase RayT
MSAHVFHQIYLHYVWHTKDDRPILDAKMEAMVYDYLRRRCRLTKGVYLHGLGGTETHVHAAFNIEPFVSISGLIGDLKGASSHDINKELGEKVLAWQRGYGVVSFGKNNLPWVLNYLADQKTHHASNTTFDRLERTAFDDDGTPLDGPDD